jgi:hypothetical protein
VNILRHEQKTLRLSKEEEMKVVLLKLTPPKQTLNLTLIFNTLQHLHIFLQQNQMGVFK